MNAADARIHILVVDDEPMIRRFAAQVLEQEGYVVLEASDGAQALDLIRAATVPLGVVVTDIVMPGLNGVELLQVVATSHPDLPFILMTGYATAQLTEMGIAPPCATLAKPFPAERLLEEVRRCIKGENPIAAPH
ncbi:MAG: response regulator [Gemmatimonadales bacterium]